ncbi:unannotated protein [freshwater metagenome]|uniref:Unannotated protein n=1 Tax=freshwater metagenome TaxID=449393 RepID=A0A6J7HC75_9ZZZZ|nr:hypothetical protein [Actinomycetota bacterium]
MKTIPVIRQIGHVALRTTDLDACIDQATQVMGLAISQQDDTGVYLTESEQHHSIHYIADDRNGLDHIGLEAYDEDALVEIRKRLEQENISFVTHADDEIYGDVISFIGPEDIAYQIYAGIPQSPSEGRQHHLFPARSQPGVRPKRFGHLTFLVSDADKMQSFVCDVLDFRISDVPPGGYFVRCNVDHHGLGIMGGFEKARLHHHAWEVRDIGELANIGDRVYEYGKTLTWGPVRHGVGNNIAAYFTDPTGCIVEYYCDMQLIYNDSDFVMREWKPEDWHSMWMPERPTGGRDFGVTTIHGS